MCVCDCSYRLSKKTLKGAQGIPVWQSTCGFVDFRLVLKVILSVLSSWTGDHQVGDTHWVCDWKHRSQSFESCANTGYYHSLFLKGFYLMWLVWEEEGQSRAKMPLRKRSYTADLLTQQQGEVLKVGFLRKKGHVRRNWLDRWFVLTTEGIYYYKNRTVS